MSIPVEIDNHFVRDQIKELCKEYRERKDDCRLPLPLCQRDSTYPCELETASTNFEWGKCTKCVGSCSVGHPLRTDWINDEVKHPLVNCLESSVNIDWLLHLSQKRYRDHSNHQLFVGVLGWFLLGCIVNGGKQTFKEWIAGRSHLRAEEVEIAWWIAALLHDHAYPLGHILRIVSCITSGDRDTLLERIWGLIRFDNPRSLYSNLFLKRLHEVSGLEETDSYESRREKIRGLLSGYLIPYFFSSDELFKKPGDCYDHGILAAANIASMLDDQHRDNKIIGAVIRAIAIHNGGACPERVDVQEDPLAFLLILCDECQEWGRRIVVEDKAKSESESIRLNGLEKTEGDGNYVIGEHLIVVFDYTDSVLEDTGWDYLKFRNSKDRAFRRFCVSRDFPIKRIDYQVLIPHRRAFRSLE